MLRADHSNIDGPPLAVKCVRKFWLSIGGEVARACAVCVCVCVCESDECALHARQLLHAVERAVPASESFAHETRCRTDVHIKGQHLKIFGINNFMKMSENLHDSC